MTVSLERPRQRPSPRPRNVRRPAPTVRRSTRDRIAWPIAAIIMITMVIMFAFAMMEMAGVDVRPAIDAVVSLLEKM